MRAPLHILLVRHGESESNAGQATADPATAALTPLGERQASAFANSLAQAPALFVVSPYRRAQLTAAPSIARFTSVPVETWPVHEFTFLSPDGYKGSTPASRKPAVDAYWAAADPRARLGVGAESFADLLARVADARARLNALRTGPVVVFSHRKFLNALLWSWLAGEPAVSTSRMKRFREFDHAMPFENGACVHVRLDEDGAWVGHIRKVHVEESST